MNKVEMKFPAITRDALRGYAKASLDENPIHLDDEVAKSKGFPSVIAHGMLSMGYMASFVQEKYPSKKVKKLWCRFKKPTFPSDVLAFEGEPSSGKEGLSVKITVRNQNGEITTEGEALIEN